MKLKNVFSFRNKRFFLLIDELAAHLQNMSVLFDEAMTGDSKTLDAQVTRMEEKEHAVAILVGELRLELGQNLLSPFDREDILYLTADLKYVAGNMLHVVRQMRNYMIADIPTVTRAIAKHNITAVTQLAGILTQLKYTSKLVHLASVCVEIKQLQSTCDEQLEQANAQMVNAGTEGVALIKMMDHFTALDRMLDKMNDTVNICENIIIKYS